MKMKTKKKTFDCVEMQHEGGRRVMEMVKGMTMEQEVEFWRKRTAELRRRQEQIRKANQDQ